MFYNVENLFDTINNPDTNDESFTPLGEKNWNTYRYQKKISQIASVIRSIGTLTHTVDLIGLAEIENKKVVEDIFVKKKLSKYPYNIIHKKSLDRRGISVALIYNSQSLTKENDFILRPETIQSRDILGAWFITNTGYSIGVLVNHWPSRLGGVENSASKRLYMSRLIQQWLEKDSLVQNKTDFSLILLGDFNDNPQDISIQELIKLLEDKGFSIVHQFTPPYNRNSCGTLTYQGKWHLFDQIIIATKGKKIITKGTFLYINPLMLDQKQHPLRTYQGPFYMGGFSDHLPIYADLDI